MTVERLSIFSLLLIAAVPLFRRVVLPSRLFNLGTVIAGLMAAGAAAIIGHGTKPKVRKQNRDDRCACNEPKDLASGRDSSLRSDAVLSLPKE